MPITATDESVFAKNFANVNAPLQMGFFFSELASNHRHLNINRQLMNPPSKADQVMLLVLVNVKA
jgi:hypothetical protein